MTQEEKLVQRLTVMFGEPRTEDPGAYLREFTAAIKGWPADVLDEAGNKVIKGSTFWPKPAEVIEMARHIASERGRVTTSTYLRNLDEQERGWKNPTPAEKGRVRTMMNATLAVLDGKMSTHEAYKVIEGCDAQRVLERSEAVKITKRMTGERHGADTGEVL